MPCSQCQATSPPGQRFCGNCGSEFNPAPITLNTLIEQHVKQAIDTQLKDQKVVAVEIAESVFERISKWTKTFILLLTIPIGAALYMIYGQYRDFSKLIERSRSGAEQILESTSAKAHDVDQRVKAADDTMKDLNNQIDKRSELVHALDSKLTANKIETERFESSIKEYQAKVTQSGTDVLRMISTLQSQLSEIKARNAALSVAISCQDLALSIVKSINDPSKAQILSNELANGTCDPIWAEFVEAYKRERLSHHGSELNQQCVELAAEHGRKIGRHEESTLQGRHLLELNDCRDNSYITLMSVIGGPPGV